MTSKLLDTYMGVGEREREIDKREGWKERAASQIGSRSLLEQKPPERELETFSLRSLISFMCTILLFLFLVEFPFFFLFFYLSLAPELLSINGRRMFRLPPITGRICSRWIGGWTALLVDGP